MYTHEEEFSCAGSPCGFCMIHTDDFPELVPSTFGRPHIPAALNIWLPSTFGCPQLSAALHFLHASHAYCLQLPAALNFWLSPYPCCPQLPGAVYFLRLLTSHTTQQSTFDATTLVLTIHFHRRPNIHPSVHNSQQLSMASSVFRPPLMWKRLSIHSRLQLRAEETSI
jgi:hypothetical protein